MRKFVHAIMSTQHFKPNKFYKKTYWSTMEKGFHGRLHHRPLGRCGKNYENTKCFHGNK